MQLLGDIFGLFITGLVLTISLVCARKLIGLDMNIFVINRNNKSMVLSKLTELGCFSTWKIVNEQKEYLDGFIFNFSYPFCIGYIHGGEDILTLHIFCHDSTKTMIKKLQTSQIGSLDSKRNKKKPLSIYNRSGTSYHFLNYSKFDFDCENRFNLLKGSKQEAIVSDIIHQYKSSRKIKEPGKKLFTTVFIEGDSGTGKSTIAPLVAHALNGSLCKDFNPSEPGDTLGNLLEYVDDNHDVFIAIDEFDIIIYKAHHNLIERHKNIPTMIFDKKSLNRFLDDIEYYPRIFLILTSNRSSETVSSWDKSYLRDGRIDKKYIL